MKLIIGLGNPEKEYKKTRHNAGFLAIDKIASNFNFPSFTLQLKFNAEISESIIDNKKVILTKPQTFMNDSGRAVKAIMDYYKIGIQDVIVIHDDIDIFLDKYKITANRSSAGHKGVQSIINHLGTKDFSRIRIGVEIINRKIPTEKFVLEKFGKEEMKIVEKVIEEIVRRIVGLLDC